ncbi:hypothetical protein GFS31_20620 [Leptolyngbya sp. BL0902]|uniref:hypothetical protein n=1 Tax=Leptolyngbya sp. BL0902 TaxID=1115757 RepID=UPI0018E89276|nr:hypothetical protein [Leptolyngbya sp. BL0902]QQE65374.1 hypothetical protein GFS31_20620 [Leptolyngbya sp. BL0902]
MSPIPAGLAGTRRWSGRPWPSWEKQASRSRYEFSLAQYSATLGVLQCPGSHRLELQGGFAERVAEDLQHG